MKLSKSQKLFLKAYHYNWDDGMNTLNKIIANKDCDKATALLIYWLGVPNYYNQYKEVKDIPAHEFPTYQLLKKIEQLIMERKLNETISFIPDASRIPAELGNIPVEMTRPSTGEINAQDLINKNVGELKLLKACQEGNIDIVKDLIEHQNFDINQKIDGSFPLEMAVIYNEIKIVEYLILKGANIKIKTGPSGFTLHHWACQSQNIDISTLLCEHGLNIDAKGKWKRTALHQNVYWENDRWVKSEMFNVLKYLLAKGADPSLKDVDGANTFDLAEKAGNTAALEILNNI
jgi:hypothetical protein